MTVVVSQPMFFPWAGLFEQVRLADVFMHYDDVQLPQGRSFMTRVQIKTNDGIFWLSAPIDRNRSGRMINEVVFSSHENWREQQLKTLRHAYGKAPYFSDMIELAEAVYAEETDNLAEFNIRAIERIANWLGLRPKFCRSSASAIPGASTQRLVDICLSFQADRYVTGLGALKYLDHGKFEEKGIAVEYMNYNIGRYAQRHGDFTPYVSILDAVANCGRDVLQIMNSTTTSWRKMQ